MRDDAEVADVGGHKRGKYNAFSNTKDTKGTKDLTAGK
jgi:hypothetical protein